MQSKQDDRISPSFKSLIPRFNGPINESLGPGFYEPRDESNMSTSQMRSFKNGSASFKSPIRGI